ncbi:MAG: hypothetical protein IIX06_02530, partial [Bacteroidales bacterium]|nr:hypothetical protein [Bacteroidales bacterium]
NLTLIDCHLQPDYTNTVEVHNYGDDWGYGYSWLISVLYSMLGSSTFPDTKGKILFLEDLDEYLYHIDRMMFAFERAGIFNGIKGLIVGGLTKMHDNNIPFGKTAEEIILERVADKGIPVCFNFPAGHIDDNRAIILGRKIRLSIRNAQCIMYNV